MTLVCSEQLLMYDPSKYVAVINVFPKIVRGSYCMTPECAGPLFMYHTSMRMAVINV